MSISINTALRSYLLDTGSFKGAMDNSTLTIYSGAVPDVNSAAGTALAVVGNADLDFAASASNGVIAKSGTWKTADNSTTAGEASYYRLASGSYIVQGTVVAGDGTGDLILATTTIPASGTITIDHYTITMPGA